MSYPPFKRICFRRPLRLLMADCRPPSKASNFATSDRGSAWYAALKPPLARSTALTPALLALDGKHFRDSFMS